MRPRSPSRRAFAALTLALLLSLSLHTAAAEAPVTGQPSWLARADSRTPLGPDQLALRWLGTAGYEIRTARTTILIDPYFTRDGLWKLLTRPARPDASRIRQYVTRADAVFVGHSHFDHMLDAPAVASELKAPLYVSEPAMRIARAEGLAPSLQRVLAPRSRVTVGDLEIEALPSRHSDMPTQWLAGGELPPEVRVPMGFLDYKNGPVYTFMVRWRGRQIYHSGSAELVEAELATMHADVVLFCLSGWTSTPGVFKRLNAALAPRVVIPMHDDDFFQPFSAGFVENPLAYRADALAAIKRDIPSASLVTLDFFDEVRLTDKEEIP